MTSIKKNKLSVLMILIYGGLFCFRLEDGITAINNTGYYLKELLLVMPVVIIFTILINAWVPQKTITKHLGKHSGLKGNILALLVGMFSTGPIYAAFPIAAVLKKKGSSIENIVIILSAWAVVKVPMLFNEVRFLGIDFMLTRWLLTVIAIIIMGKITQRLLDRKTT
jgi:uncharacterized membrane protein YraQ (UPF0718 family)